MGGILSVGVCFRLWGVLLSRSALPLISVRLLRIGRERGGLEGYEQHTRIVKAMNYIDNNSIQRIQNDVGSVDGWMDGWGHLELVSEFFVFGCDFPWTFGRLSRVPGCREEGGDMVLGLNLRVIRFPLGVL